ncbi:MAG TPA: HNH endonuclease signature motif containing protein [Polyangiaceae bacterium]|jgi:hypothetical protein
MTAGYRLGHLRNNELLSALSALVQRGNQLTAELLAHLAELDQRRLHLELGFPSLFAYCTESLHLSEPAAGRRIAAARVCRRFPDVFALVARGELHLSALCALAPHLTSANAEELLRISKHKTRRQVDELIAARFPRPAVRAQIRRLPSRSEVGSSPLEIPEWPTPSPGARPAQARIEPISSERYGVHFTANVTLRRKLEQARALASHRLPNGDLASVVELALDALIEKERFSVGTRPRAVRHAQKSSSTQLRATFTTRTGGDIGARLSPGDSTRASTDARSRHIPSAAARAVYERDRGQCAFVSADGRRCSARHLLQLDHVTPWAKGGAATAENLRLLCRAHNQQHARAHFGSERVEAIVASARSAR